MHVLKIPSPRLKFVTFGFIYKYTSSHALLHQSLKQINNPLFSHNHPPLHPKSSVPSSHLGSLTEYTQPLHEVKSQPQPQSQNIHHAFASSSAFPPNPQSILSYLQPPPCFSGLVTTSLFNIILRVFLFLKRKRKVRRSVEKAKA